MSLSLSEILRAEPERFFKVLAYISHYIPTGVIIQTLLISKNDTSSIVLPGWAILEKLIFSIALASGPIFSSIQDYLII